METKRFQLKYRQNHFAPWLSRKSLSARRQLENRRVRLRAVVLPLKTSNFVRELCGACFSSFTSLIEDYHFKWPWRFILYKTMFELFPFKKTITKETKETSLSGWWGICGISETGSIPGEDRTEVSIYHEGLRVLIWYMRELNHVINASNIFQNSDIFLQFMMKTKVSPVIWHAAAPISKINI